MIFITYSSPENNNYIITLQPIQMTPEKPARTNRRGYYTKQLAAIKNQNHQFKRNKKGIKKENKHICRQAREKKRLYIDSLERVKTEQQEEIDRLRGQVAELRQKLEGQQKSGAHSGIKDLIEEYKELIKSLHLKDESLIKRNLSVLRSRFGIAGRDRIKWIQESLLRTIELSMPMHFRVLLENCDNGKAFFNLVGGGQKMRGYRLNFSEDKKDILRQMKPKIKQAKQRYNQLYQRLLKVFFELQEEGIKSQKIIDEIEDKVSHPIFIGNLLMSLDNNRKDEHIKEIYPINQFKRLWQASEKTGENIQSFREDYYLQEVDQEAFDEMFYGFQ